MARWMRRGLERSNAGASRWILIGAAIVAGVAGLATGASAEDAGAGFDADTLSREFEAMRQEMQRLRDDNLRLHDEVDELRATNSDQWLTEQRAEEIRSLVNDVLADADVRSSLLQNGLVAGWSEHFFLASPDGRFKLQFSGQLQFRFIHNYTPRRTVARDRHRQGFETTRTKLTFRGHVFNPDLSFLIRTTPTRNEPGLVTGLYFLQDAWIQYRFDNYWSARVGQFKLPFNREELVSSANQLAVERSLVNENMTTGRTQGVELTWADETRRVSVAFGDGAQDGLLGLGNLAGTQPVNSNALIEDTEFAYTARFESLMAGEWRQFADFTSPPGDEFGLLLGIGAHYQQTESNSAGGAGFNPRNEHRWTAVTADISAEWGGASLYAAYLYVYIDHGSFGQININGMLAQAAVYVTPKVEVFGRWEYGFIDADFDFSDLHLATIGMNYYLDGHDLKWTTDIGFVLGQLDQVWYGGMANDIAGYFISIDPSEPEIVIRTQLQLLF